MTTSRIRLDRTQISVVVTCSACPNWAAFAWDNIDGWRVGRDHEANVHPGNRQAAAAYAKAAERAGITPAPAIHAARLNPRH